MKATKINFIYWAVSQFGNGFLWFAIGAIFGTAINTFSTVEVLKQVDLGINEEISAAIADSSVNEVCSLQELTSFIESPYLNNPKSLSIYPVD